MEKKHSADEYDLMSVKSNSFLDTTSSIDHREEFATNPRQEIPAHALGRRGFFVLTLPEVSIEHPDRSLNRKPETVTSDQRDDLSPSAERVVAYPVNNSCEAAEPSDKVNSSKKVELPIEALGMDRSHRDTSALQADGEYFQPVEGGSELTKPKYVNDRGSSSPVPVDYDDNPLSLLEELQFAITHKPDGNTDGEDIRVNHDHDNSIEQFDLLHVSAVKKLRNYISHSVDVSSTEPLLGDNPDLQNTQRRSSEIASIPFELLHDNIKSEDIPTKTRSEDDDSRNKDSQLAGNEEVQKFIAELYENERKADTKLRRTSKVEVPPRSQDQLGHLGSDAGQIRTTDNQTIHKGRREPLADLRLDWKNQDHSHVESNMDPKDAKDPANEGPLCSPETSPEANATTERGAALQEEPPQQLVYVHSDPEEMHHGSGHRGSITLEQYPPPEHAADARDSLHSDPSHMAQAPPKIACHVCTDLIPLIQRISRQIACLESLPLRREEERLRADVDKVFTCLYDALDAREAELLQLVDNAYGREDADHDKTLLDEIQNANFYCEKMMTFSTKSELLELSHVILYHADELLIKGVTVTPDSGVDADFIDSNIRGVVEEVEEFGKVFNVKDVDDAVRNKSFPKEHTSSEGYGGSDVMDGIQPPLPLGDPLTDDVLPQGPDYESLSAEELRNVSQV